MNEPVVVEMLKRLRIEGLSRHDALDAIGLFWLPPSRPPTQQRSAQAAME